jgi:hypothetical protein
MEFIIVSILLLIILVYNLYYTYTNDYGMFLYLILLITTGLFIFLYIEYKINLIISKVDDGLSIIKTQIENNLINMDLLSNTIKTLFNHDK